jgi:membrane fusion protein (multidrug efflux system)
MGLVFLFLTFAKVNDYGQGFAIVRLERKIAVTAKAQGVVTRVPVQVGERVGEGSILAELDDSREHAEVLRVEHELDQELIRWLRDPSDSAAGRQIAELRTQREVALVNQRARTVVAPQAGVVNDIRAMAGQVINLGDTVVSMSNADDPAYTVLAIFPGRYRPQARVGSQMRLEFVGYPFSYQSVTVLSLGEEVVGPKEARRIVGSEQADSIAIDGPVFVAKAVLPSDGFSVDRVKYGYFDGLVATAQVKLRGEPILVMLIPGLRRIYDAWNPQ